MQNVSRILLVVGIAVAALVYFGRQGRIGTRFEISKNEAVFYSGKSTEQDARTLGKLLTTAGFFIGEGTRDVLLRKDDDGVTIVSFVVKDGSWDEADKVAIFRIMGTSLASNFTDGQPLLVRLVDTKLNPKKELQIENSFGKRFEVSEQEGVYYSGGFTEDEASKLAKMLKDAKYFQGSGARDVFLKKTPEGTKIQFIVKDGIWDDPGMILAHKQLLTSIAPSINPAPVTLEMLDKLLEVKKSIVAEQPREGGRSQ